MSEYNNLLQELRSKVIELQKPIIATAIEYIPKMYTAILKENPTLTPIQARQRIEKDCSKEFWSKRTILSALPDETKNLEKQKAGRLRHKNKIQKSAATIAAPKLKDQIVIYAVRKDVLENELYHIESSNNILKVTNDNKGIETGSDITFNKQLLDFEFCLKFKDVRKYMTSLFNTNTDNRDVWFHGRIDTNSGQVVEANTGRNSQVGE